jgi:hypothetical protein
VVSGAYWIAYRPRVNGFQTGYSFGSVHSCGGEYLRARAMKRCQISAGNVPPATAIPCTFSIGISACG